MELIEKKCNRNNFPFDEAEKKNFFSIYSTNHTEFRFSEYDCNLIMRVVEHVKHVLDIEGTAYFSLHNNDIILSDRYWYFQQKMTEEKHKFNQFDTQTHRVLHKLVETADKNASRPISGYRFDDELKSYASYLRFLAGPLAYETLQRNMPLALPSLVTTNRFMARSHHSIIEGELRCDELLSFLTERKFSLCVSLSEDATRVVNRVQYDAQTNQLIGFVLPTDNNGMPTSFCFKARSASEIKSHFENGTPIANYINTIIAKPLSPSAPSFCLLVYGTDSKYTSEHVAKRWCHVTKELNKRKINVLNISADSEPRNNAAMRKLSHLGNASTDILMGVEWFKCGNHPNQPFFVQDPDHIRTKLRNWVLKTKSKTKKYPFGSKYSISASHLQYLIENESKDKHFLTKTTLNPIDRQNVESAERMCHQRVIDLLKTRVKNSEATAKFLEIVQNVVASFKDKTLLPKERLQKMWYSLFIVRLWRQYVLRAKSLTLKNDFLTANCYTCLELNAHSLIRIILFLKQIDKPHLFQTWNFSSQPCESFFRQIRSVSTVYSTVTNCTTKELLNRVKKIQLQTNISATNSQFIFPKRINSNESAGVIEHALPSEAEIVEIIEECKASAVSDAVKIGLLKKPVSKIDCPLNPYNYKNSLVNIRKKLKSMVLKNADLKTNTPDFKNIDLKNFAAKFEHDQIIESCPYVEIVGHRKRLVVKKTSLCWLFSKEPAKLSSDRIQRVKNSYDISGNKQTTNRRLKLGKKFSKKRKQGYTSKLKRS